MICWSEDVRIPKRNSSNGPSPPVLCRFWTVDAPTDQPTNDHSCSLELERYYEMFCDSNTSQRGGNEGGGRKVVAALGQSFRISILYHSIEHHITPNCQ